jgi:hypothetical protein
MWMRMRRGKWSRGQVKARISLVVYMVKFLSREMRRPLFPYKSGTWSKHLGISCDLEFLSLGHSQRLSSGSSQPVFASRTTVP